MSCSKAITAISLADIVRGRESYVRTTHDDMIYAVDLIMVVARLERDQAGLALRRILKTNLISIKVIQRNTGGKGNYKTQLVNFEDAMELVMVLAGKNALQVRKQFKDVIMRYLDGDRSMCCEIEENQAMGKAKSYAKFANKIINKVDGEDYIKRAHEMPQTFYVYATKSPAFPGLIKIGKTENVSRRVGQLNTACAPAPHVIVAVAPSFDTGRDETTAHEFFSNARREGEFFELQDAEVLAYFATHITARYNTELGQNIAKLHGLSV
jgi:hypothetical protein